MTPPFTDEPVVGCDYAGILEKSEKRKESAGNLSPAPPQWTKGPGVSAGRTTGSRVPAPPWWVFTYARSMPREALVQKCQKSRGKRLFFDFGQNFPAEPDCRESEKLVVTRTSELADRVGSSSFAEAPRSDVAWASRRPCALGTLGDPLRRKGRHAAQRITRCETDKRSQRNQSCP